MFSSLAIECVHILCCVVSLSLFSMLVAHQTAFAKLLSSAFHINNCTLLHSCQHLSLLRHCQYKPENLLILLALLKYMELQH